MPHYTAVQALLGEEANSQSRPHRGRRCKTLPQGGVGLADVGLMSTARPPNRARGRIPGSLPRPVACWNSDRSESLTPSGVSAGQAFVFSVVGLALGLAAKAAQGHGPEAVGALAAAFTAWREAGGAVEKVEPKKKS